MPALSSAGKRVPVPTSRFGSDPSKCWLLLEFGLEFVAACIAIIVAADP
jgi:hypothetical protein